MKTEKRHPFQTMKSKMDLIMKKVKQEANFDILNQQIVETQELN
jgi:hypothetical protein